MSDSVDDLCPRPERVTTQSTAPHAPPIYLSSVYECADPDHADRVLSGQEPGYAYLRDGHPNADLLAEKCRQLHGAERAAIAGSGMAALALAMLSQVKAGDHLVVSNQLYGRTSALLVDEAARYGVTATVVDPCDLDAVRGALGAKTRLLVIETISNPLLRVADLSALAEIAHRHGALVLADNTLAGPAVCRPLTHGADLVMESLTKSMNGHSDVVLGLLCGAERDWQRVPSVLSTWGLASAPFDCWLALRGIATLAIRAQRACANALRVAQRLTGHASIEAVSYPGLSNHPDHALARKQFAGLFGSMVSFTLRGGRPAATGFMKAARQIPFCPSLGELNTTLSHPESTSHRAVSEPARRALGITGGTIRLSVGIESGEAVLAALEEGLAGLG